MPNNVSPKHKKNKVENFGFNFGSSAAIESLVSFEIFGASFVEIGEELNFRIEQAGLKRVVTRNEAVAESNSIAIAVDFEIDINLGRTLILSMPIVFPSHF